MSPALLSIAVALVAGGLLRFVVNLEPSALCAWLAPGLLLALVLHPKITHWRITLLAACLLGYQVNAGYYLRVMPLPPAMAIIVGQSLLWLFVLAETRRVVTRSTQPWTVLALPVFWVAVDTLLAALHPDGNWASLAYTQADFLPLMQFASLLGVPGVLFLLLLLPSAFVLAWRAGWPRPHCVVLGGVLLLEIAAVAWGVFRLQPIPAGPSLMVGLVSVDEAIGPRATPVYVRGIRAAYDTQIAAAAAESARLILLPEKIGEVEEADAADWREHWSNNARQHAVWLVAGLAVRTSAGIVNQAWLFGPDGSRRAVYDKHFLAPPERTGYRTGNDFALVDIEGVRVGLAICKDMHFASLGRDYGLRGAELMLVPAWDFTLDAWMAARMTAVRGLESGYGLARTSREGLLGITDAYGHVLSERQSAPLPGGRLVAAVPIRPRVATVYAAYGHWFGWLCVAVALAGMVWSRRRQAVVAVTQNLVS